MIPLRGNLDTRLKKLWAMNLDGIVLALAGVKRLGLEEKITEILPRKSRCRQLDRAPWESRPGKRMKKWRNGSVS